MSNTNFRRLNKVVAGTTLALVVAAALAFGRGESTAHDFSAAKAAASQHANLGDQLPGTLGSGIAPILW